MMFAYSSFTYLSDGQLSYTGMNFGEKGPKGKKAQGTRTRGDVLNDLMAWTQQHNGDTLTFACWQAMDLMHDIRKSETHCFAVTLRKNAVWTNPRAMYSLVDAAVLPLALLSKHYENVANAYDEKPVNVIEEMLVNDRKRRTTEDGALGSVLVMSFELAPDENMTVEEAVAKKSVPVWQPLGLFKEHKKFLSALPDMAHSFWKPCLKNALNGGAYSMKFQPWPATRS
ncbi:hypothetical protein DAEQUDRAFT_807051 [Daedalea quercina L-15889]|uniref:Uncharacterized protein n=1 Tax=Daedalea quercina L-15889 TaxID=1314783 RepID=A0A165UCK8_9APHY|nr:hypothetical protein DAEQUDRAFT_807051 [Daedalea quercina L-15889]